MLLHCYTRQKFAAQSLFFMLPNAKPMPKHLFFFCRCVSTMLKNLCSVVSHIYFTSHISHAFAMYYLAEGSTEEIGGSGCRFLLGIKGIKLVSPPINYEKV